MKKGPKNQNNNQFLNCDTAVAHNIRMIWDSQSSITLMHYSLNKQRGPPQKFTYWSMTMHIFNHGECNIKKKKCANWRETQFSSFYFSLSLSHTCTHTHTHTHTHTKDIWLFLTGSKNGLLITRLLSIVLYFKGQINISEKWIYSCPPIKGL